MAKNPSVTVQPNGRIVVSPLVALPEPVHLVGLNGELVQRWPMTSLIDILKETDLRVGITPQFASATSHEALDPETLKRRLLLCLYGLGTNAGLKRVANGDHGESVADLRYVLRRYVRREPLRQAIADVVNATFRARRPDIRAHGWRNPSLAPLPAPGARRRPTTATRVRLPRPVRAQSRPPVGLV
jgi:hypothetical protein